MTDTLYIIGNGFDLHHGLRTSYANFRDDYARKKPIWTLLDAIYGDLLNNDMFWWHFEEMLSSVDYKRLIEPMYRNALMQMKVKNFLKGQLPPLFEYWILNMKKDVKQDEELCVKTDAKFFTFNYTMLLEELYHINDENVWHIHRSIKDKEPVLLGHDTSIKELTMQYSKAIDEMPIMRRDLADELLKEIANASKNVNKNICANENKFCQYKDIIHFVAMGFSFNDIDMPYIKKIISENKQIGDTDWQLYFHNDEDKEVINKLKVIGIKDEQILKPIPW